MASTNESTFLGFTFKGTNIRWSDKAFAEFRRRVKKLTGRSWGVSMAYRFAKLAEYLRGWMGCFGISEYYRPLPEIDHWLRRRVRMCYLKRWRWCRTKVRELTKLGTNLRLAISIGLSRKGPYRLAKTLATQSGMTNKWLKDQGLLSVKELWVNIHYPATAWAFFNCFKKLLRALSVLISLSSPSYPQTPTRGELHTGKNIALSQVCSLAHCSHSQPPPSH